MSESGLPPVAGYVLAGGQSTRMGTDKALVMLAGKPLVEHAVLKMGHLCKTVRILSGNPVLAAYAPLVADETPGCGPLGGVVAALLDSSCDWNLILPVDVPFLSTKLLAAWLRSTVAEPPCVRRLSILCVGAQAHPTLLLVHREALPYLRQCLGRGMLRLRVALEEAAEGLARERQIEAGQIFWQAQWNAVYAPPDQFQVQSGQRAMLLDAVPLDPEQMFANLNTPEQVAEAAGRADLLAML